jgi:N-formylglutamate deformylase
LTHHRPAAFVESTEVYALSPGSGPLIVSVPHAGTDIPEALLRRLTPLALTQPDTDWHVDRVYDFVHELDASLLVAHYSRYVIDLNRPPDDAALYAGAARTGLCPSLSFAGEPLYLQGADHVVPPAEVQERREHYWQPYHDGLRELITSRCAAHGYALLLDAHSIHSTVPRLFQGQLPDINLGCNGARSCAPSIIDGLKAVLGAQRERTWVIDGRFKGGYITRHYGQPAQRVHALQIELAQCSYMDEASSVYELPRAAPLQTLLRALVDSLLAFRCDSSKA